MNIDMCEPGPRMDSMSKENFVADDRVYILGRFDKSISSEVIPGLMALMDAKASTVNRTIEIYINSCGGYADELWSLLAVLDIARLKGFKILTYVIGCAYSCASLLAIYGDHRVMSKFGDNVAHLGAVWTESHTIEQNKRQNDHIKKHFNNIINFYVEHTKLPKAKVEELLSDDKLHLTPKECLKYGFCDEII